MMRLGKRRLSERHDITVPYTRMDIVEVKTGLYSKKAFSSFTVLFDKNVVKEFENGVASSVHNFKLFPICRFKLPGVGATYINEDGEVCIALTRENGLDIGFEKLEDVQRFLLEILYRTRNAATGKFDDDIWKAATRMIEYIHPCMPSYKEDYDDMTYYEKCLQVKNADYSDLIGVPMNPFELTLLQPLVADFFKYAEKSLYNFDSYLDAGSSSDVKYSSRQSDMYIQIFRMLK